jgi:hypothetical protein
MTKINFDEASDVELTANNKAALKVTNTGQGAAGVWGETTQYGTAGVKGTSTGSTSVGVLGENAQYQSAGVKGVSTGQEAAGVFGYSTGQGAVGVLGEGPVAGRFVGNVEVTGDISLLNADCAEDFDIAESEENIEAGTVMVLDEKGLLQPSYHEYDKKVAGIVSGSSGYKPAIVLDRQQNQDQDKKNKARLPIALMGKVYCKVDARHSSVGIGDLLTTSSTKGYAMKAEDPMKAFGAVIGKALGSIKEGLGMIPVLVTLQ